MVHKSAKHEINMCEGPIFTKLLKFSLPIVFASVLQLLFNTADMIVVGKFGSGGSLAAVGATNSITNLFVNVFLGVSLGAGAQTARCYGSDDSDGAHKTVHTSVALGLISGLFISVLGIILAPYLLRMMDCPSDVIGKSTLYMRIYFCGMPFSMLYNFESAILRAVGDSKRPLYYIATAGVVNVGLNLIFVIFLKMDVAGVATATVISQIISVALTTRALLLDDGMIKLELKKIKIHIIELKHICLIGVPAGLQSCLFSISNVTIQTSINSFGSAVMAGSAASQSVEGYVYALMHSVAQASLNFAAQNFGAKKYKRIHKVLLESILSATILGFVAGNIVNLYSENLLSLFTDVPAEILAGAERVSIVCTLYWLCGILDVVNFVLRGIGCSLPPMLISIVGVVGIRIVWVHTYFVSHRSIYSLLISYPVSWIVVIIVELIVYVLYTTKKFNYSIASK